MAYISDMMTWDSLTSSALMSCWTRCALYDYDEVQTKLIFSTKYHPASEVDSTLFETDLWRMRQLTRPELSGRTSLSPRSS